MTPSLYEGFVYRGWRRSGIHLYKPRNFESCCPTLTIRLPTAEYVPTKSQSKLLRRMNQLVTLGSPGANQNTQKSQAVARETYQGTRTENELQQAVQKSGILQVMEEITNRILFQVLSTEELAALQQKDHSREWKSKYRLLQASKKDIKRSQQHASCLVCAQISGTLSSVSRETLVTKVIQGVQGDAQFQLVSKGDSVSVVSLVAHHPSGQIRCTLRVEDQLMSNSNHAAAPARESSSRNEKMQKESTQRDKLGEWYRKTTGKPLDPGQRRIIIQTMPAHQSALIPEVHQLYVHYQTSVHDDPNPFIGERKKEDCYDENNRDTNPQNGHGNNDENASNDRVHSEDSDDPPANPHDLDWGNAPDYFQDRIGSMLTDYISPVQEQHRNVVLENFYSFYQFLVEAPFPLTPVQRRISPPHVFHDVPRDSNGSKASSSKIDCGLYHQHYRLGDMLIAVGVVDILPSGLSSVYLFYHPTFSHDLVALGKYAILKEIEYARDTLKLPFYYLGYYIESCQKMRYKAEYKPSQILCPKYFQWVDATEAVARLQKTPRHVCPLVDSATDENEENALQKHRSTVALHQLQMDIGAGINVTIDMLQPSGVQVVKPILENFVTEAGPDLSVQCLVKLS
jgi:arginyl-tRNA---protein transferase